VGGSGKWEGQANNFHWSLTSGGSAVPNAYPGKTSLHDNAVFDQNSFTPTSKTVITSVPTLFFHNMYWLNTESNAVFMVGGNMQISGTLHLAPNMLFLNNSGVTTMTSSDIDTIFTAGNQNVIKNLSLNGTGTWHLASYLNVDNDITLDQGTLVTNDYGMRCSKFISTPADPSNQRTFFIENSEIVIKSPDNPPYLSWNVDNTFGSFFSFTGGNSLIRFMGSPGLCTMHAGKGLKYDNILFDGLGRLEVFGDSIIDVTINGNGEIIGDSTWFHDCLFQQYGMINGNNNIFHDVEIWGNGDIGNLSLPPNNLNTNKNHFHNVDIGKQGRIYCDTCNFENVYFATHHKHDCGSVSCVYCGNYDDGHFYGSYNTIFHHLEFNQEGRIYGTANVIDSVTWSADGWVLQGSNQFGNINVFRNFRWCNCGTHLNVLTLQKDSTQSLLGNILPSGEYCCGHTLLQSSGGITEPAALFSQNPIVIDYFELKGITAMNALGVADSAIRSIDGGGNNNWDFNQIYQNMHMGPVSISAVFPCPNSTNGTLIVSGTGGVPPYSYGYWENCYPFYYYWHPHSNNDSIWNLCAGSVAVSIMDSYGCRLDTSIIIPSTPQIEMNNVIVDNITCYGFNNGRITLEASGGIGQLTYSIDNITFTTVNVFDSLVPGNYTVFVRDEVGCSASFGISQIYDPPFLNLDLGGENFMIKCHGDKTGLITAQAIGGTPPYNYQIVGPLNPNSAYPLDTISFVSNDQISANVYAGLYNVIVADQNACKVDDITQRFEPNSITLDFSTGFIGNCNMANGWWAKVFAMGGTQFPAAPHYTFQWNTGATTQQINNLSPGTYWVTVSDKYNCYTVDTVEIMELSGYVSQLQNVPCKGGNSGFALVQGLGGSSTITSPYQYYWSNGQNTALANNLSAGMYYYTITDANSCSYVDSVLITEPPDSVYIHFETGNTLCYGGGGGWAKVLAAGGTSPYNYQWSNGASSDSIGNMLSGVHYVTVTDMYGCVVTGSVLINQPPPGQVSLTCSAINCQAPASYQINAIVVGGTPPYFYTWSYGLSISSILQNVPEGSYSVTVGDANNCLSVGSITIQNLDVNVNSINVSCFGGSNGKVHASGNGGTPPYTYQWTNMATMLTHDSSDWSLLAVGSYQLVVTDSSGCQIVRTVAISQPIALIIDSLSISNPSCYGLCDGQIWVNISGGSYPYVINWGSSPFGSSHVTNLCAGTYMVTVTDSRGCHTFGSGTLNQPPQIIVSYTKEDILCNPPVSLGSINITASGGTGVLYYSINGQNGPYSTNPFFTGLPSGTYSIFVIDANGCSADPIPVTISTLPVLSVSLSSSNPSYYGALDGAINAEVSGGTPPYGFIWSNGSTTQNISGLPAGCYTVTVVDVNGCFTLATRCLFEYEIFSIGHVDTMVTCHGMNDGTILAWATGGVSPYHFVWSNGIVEISSQSSQIFNLVPGNYSLTVTDNNGNGISIVKNFIITEPDPINVDFTYDTVCVGYPTQFMSFTSNSNAIIASFHWNFGDPAAGYTNISTLQNPSHVYVSPGVYSVMLHVETSNGCTDTVVKAVVIQACNQINGMVHYANSGATPMTNTNVLLKQNNVVIAQEITDINGLFLFENPSIGTYTLSGQTSKAWGGANSADALQVLRHFVGQITLAGMQRRVADVDGSGYANSSDALLIVKRFVNNVSSFSVGDWAFETDSVMVTGSGIVTDTIRALCYGDVNASFTPQAKMQPSVSIVQQGDLLTEIDKEIEIPITIRNAAQIGSISLILQMPDYLTNISMVRTEFDGNFVYNVLENKLFIAWYSINPMDLNSGDVMFYVRGRLATERISEHSTWVVDPESIITDEKANMLDEQVLEFPKLKAAGDHSYLAQNVPNPFTEATDISYYLFEQGSVSLFVTDMLGRRVLTLLNEYQDAGSKRVHLTANALMPGIYNYTLQVSNSTRQFVKTLQLVVY
jgi:PKD repeat protein